MQRLSGPPNAKWALPDNPHPVSPVTDADAAVAAPLPPQLPSLEPNGVLSEASVHSLKCLLQAVRRWTFKEPKGGSARASLVLKR